MRADGGEEDKAVGVLASRLASAIAEATCEGVPDDVGKGMARQELPDALAASRSTRVLPAAAIAARVRLRHSEVELRLARSCHSSSTPFYEPG